jgi:hypothetical protein
MAPTGPRNLVYGKAGMPKLLLGYSALLNLIWLTTIFMGSLLLRLCGITFLEFITKIILLESFNWS